MHQTAKQETQSNVRLGALGLPSAVPTEYTQHARNYPKGENTRTAHCTAHRTARTLCVIFRMHSCGNSVFFQGGRDAVA